MDPFQFEFLIADLLTQIGYENVEVTRRSGDKGIDVTANLTMDGITNVKTIIQAKRYKKGNSQPHILGNIDITISSFFTFYRVKIFKIPFYEFGSRVHTT